MADLRVERGDLHDQPRLARDCAAAADDCQCLPYLRLLGGHPHHGVHAAVRLLPTLLRAALGPRRQGEGRRLRDGALQRRHRPLRRIDLAPRRDAPPLPDRDRGGGDLPAHARLYRRHGAVRPAAGDDRHPDVLLGGGDGVQYERRRIHCGGRLVAARLPDLRRRLRYCRYCTPAAVEGGDPPAATGAAPPAAR